MKEVKSAVYGEFCACIEDFNMAAICFILFKVGFDLELLSMCMYAYLL